MYKLILYLTFTVGTVFHIYFLGINKVVKIPDSFAYLQMSHHFTNFNLEGFGTGWFGFLYSLIISITGFFTSLLKLGGEYPLLFAGQVSNAILFIISGIILYKLSKIYLNKSYRILLLIIFSLNPVITHYSTNILSENLYLPIFLGLFLFLHKFIEEISLKSNFVKVSEKTIYVSKDKYIINTIIVSLFIALLYYTRAEGFIYLGAIFLITLFLLFKKEIDFKKLIKINLILVLSFFIFIGPYIYYLHTITGEWGITNKGASNLRQAEMRGTVKMDDSGFEKAVGELTEDKHHLIAGFAGGLKYDKPNIESGLKEYILENPQKAIKRILVNQEKLYTKNIPRLIIGDSLEMYRNSNFIFYKDKFFLAFLLIPLVLIAYGIVNLIFNKSVKISERRNFMPILLSLFIVASFFFTIFFVLDRYFLVFLPISLLIMVYGAQEIFNKKDRWGIMYIALFFILISIFSLGSLNYYNSNEPNDAEYELKKEVGVWINNNYLKSENVLLNKLSKKTTEGLNIMERFPITTYYSGTKKRWLTPYTNNLKDLITYAKYNKIELLIVDTMDFKKYRPKLNFLINETKNHKGLKFIKKFESGDKKVIIYKVGR